jgi:hypothetical protein
VQHGFFAADYERMPGIVATLEAHHALRMISEPIDYLALAFIAPLSTYNYNIFRHH